MSTHILTDVERVCDRIAIIDRGRLIAEAPIDELLGRHARPVLELDPEPGQDGAVAALIDRLRAAGWAGEVRVKHGVIRVVVADAAAASDQVLPIVIASGARLARYERVRPTLEDVFLELVGAAGAARAAATEDADAVRDPDAAPPVRAGRKG